MNYMLNEVNLDFLDVLIMFSCKGEYSCFCETHVEGFGDEMLGCLLPAL